MQPLPTCAELLSADATQAPVTENLHQPPAQKQLPGDGPARLGQRANQHSGAPIDQAGLLRYIVSFRNHHEFHGAVRGAHVHGHQRPLPPAQLTVYARITRRGGLDINPLRTSHPQPLPPSVRTARQ